MLKRLLQVFVAPTNLEDSASLDRIPLAAAVLLLEVAYADGDLDMAEEELLGVILCEHFKVAPDAQADLLELAMETRKHSLDLHQFTREINLGFSQPEKEQIVEAIWKLVYADGRLDKYEETLMRQLGSLIGLSHRQLIDAKLRVVKS